MKKLALKIFVIGFGAIFIALGVIYVVMMVSADRALSRAHEAVKADGRPLTLKEITPPEIPEADNAAPVYESVILRLKAESAGETSLWSELAKAAESVVSESPGVEAMDRFRALTDQPVVAQSLAEVEAGSRKRGYWKDLDYGAGVFLELPHISDLLPLTRMLCANAHSQSNAGDHEAAWDSALTALRVANALEDEPILICQLVRVAQFGLAIDAIQSLPYSAAAHQEADRLLKRSEYPTPFVAAMDGERIILGDWAFNSVGSARVREAGFASKVELVASLTDGGSLPVPFQALHALPPISTWDQAAFVASLHALAQGISDPYSPANTRRDQELLDNVGRTCLLTRIVVPAHSSAKTKLIALTARSRVTRAGLAVLKQRAEQNAWPDGLTETDDVADPFSGEPLIYRPSATGFVLYSVGEDLVDDQGRKAKDGKGDIVWRYSE